jgi:hypothetical protein
LCVIIVTHRREAEWDGLCIDAQEYSCR